MLAYVKLTYVEHCLSGTWIQEFYIYLYMHLFTELFR